MTLDGNTQPTPEDFAELLEFLPVFLSPCFQPVNRWHGIEGKDRVTHFPWPEYHPEVEKFVAVASKPCWQHRHYSPETAGKMIANTAKVGTASLDEVRSMLTYCVRGERFCDGHIGQMIKAGYVTRLLNRLKELAEDYRASPEDETVL